MTKDYELIACNELGIKYKKWVRVRARANYLGLDVFIYRPHPESYWVVTHLYTGKSMAPAGKLSPYPGGIIDYLDRALTAAQKGSIRVMAGQRLYLAHQYQALCGLPTRKQALPLIQARQEELWRLESIITGGGLPF